MTDRSRTRSIREWLRVCLSVCRCDAGGCIVLEWDGWMLVLVLVLVAVRPSARLSPLSLLFCGFAFVRPGVGVGAMRRGAAWGTAYPSRPRACVHGSEDHGPRTTDQESRCTSAGSQNFRIQQPQGDAERRTQNAERRTVTTTTTTMKGNRFQGWVPGRLSSADESRMRLASEGRTLSVCSSDSDSDSMVSWFLLVVSICSPGQTHRMLLFERHAYPHRSMAGGNCQCQYQRGKPIRTSGSDVQMRG